MAKIVIISKHPSGNFDSENRMQGCIQATCLEEIQGQSKLLISSLENRPLLLVDPKTGAEILSPQAPEGSGLAPKKAFSAEAFQKLQAFHQQTVGFSRLGGDPLLGQLTVVSSNEYSLQLTMPSDCILPYEWPLLPKHLSDRYVFAESNLGLASFWRITRSCHDIQTKQPYVLKVIPKVFLARGKGRIEQTLLELEFLKRGTDDRIILSEVSEEENNIFILQESASIGDCEKLLKLPLSENVKKYILKEMALAVNYVHKAGFVHNRITEDRFKLFNSPYHVQIKLIDFGYIGKIGTPAATDWWAYDVAAGSASIDTVAPERISTHPEIVTELTDIYSLGTIFKNSGLHDAIIDRMLNQDPKARPTVDEILLTEFFENIDKAAALTEIKEQLFKSFFADRYESSFTFSPHVSLVDKEKHKQQYLYAAVTDLSHQTGATFDVAQNSITYQDQVTNTMGWSGVTNVFPSFETPQMSFTFRILDLMQPNLPQPFTRYLDNGQWQKIRYQLQVQVAKNTALPLADPVLRPFQYQDLEDPAEPVVIEASTPIPTLKAEYTPETSLNVLSMPIKMPDRVAKLLNTQQRRDISGREFDGETIYLPEELIKGNPSHVLLNIMCSVCLEYFVNPKRLVEAYAYVTLRKGVVSPVGQSTLGQGGWHVDGLWGARTKYFPSSPFHQEPTIDRQYIMNSSEEMRTEWTSFGVNLSEFKQRASSEGLTLDQYLNKESIEPIPPAPLQKTIEDAIEQAIVKHGPCKVVHHLPANRLTFFDARVIHRAPINATGKPIARSIFRCAFSPDPFCKLGVTVNPLLGPVTPLLFYSIESPIQLSKDSDEDKFTLPKYSSSYKGG